MLTLGCFMAYRGKRGLGIVDHLRGRSATADSSCGEFARSKSATGRTRCGELCAHLLDLSGLFFHRLLRGPQIADSSFRNAVSFSPPRTFSARRLRHQTHRDS